ncbi:MAG TPA: hypothetical protein VNC84_05085 [Gammaproteobacteria bacterium]|jgi:hypothetical protein|nr:hypothetical protein [Gammaproteobacteria bacterium]
MPKNTSLVDEIRVRLEWRMAEAMERYPDLSIGDMMNVFEKFHQRRGALVQEGWHIIDAYVKKTQCEQK